MGIFFQAANERLDRHNLGIKATIIYGFNDSSGEIATVHLDSRRVAQQINDDLRDAGDLPDHARDGIRAGRARHPTDGESEMMGAVGRSCVWDRRELLAGLVREAALLVREPLCFLRRVEASSGR